MLDESFPDGEYTVYAGMYDFSTKARATAVTSDGKTLPDGAVLLETIEIDHE